MRIWDRDWFLHVFSDNVKQETDWIETLACSPLVWTQPLLSVLPPPQLCHAPDCNRSSTPLFLRSLSLHHASHPHPPPSLSQSISLSCSLSPSLFLCVCLSALGSVYLSTFIWLFICLSVHPSLSFWQHNYCVPDVLFLKRMQYVLCWLCMFTFPCCLKTTSSRKLLLFVFFHLWRVPRGWRHREKMKENID